MATKKSPASPLAAAIAALPAASVDVRIHGDPLTAAERVTALVAHLDEPLVRDAFARVVGALPADTLPILRGGADELRRLAIARRGRVASKDDAKLPAALVDEALALRASLRRVAEYHFDDDPAVEPILADLRRGSGHRDLATDLVRYAELLERAPPGLAQDRRYVPADVARAVEVAESIFTLLGRPRNAPSDQELRAVQTLVRRAYDRTITALRLALYDYPAELARLVPLYGGTRPRRAKKPAVDP